MAFSRRGILYDALRICYVTGTPDPAQLNQVFRSADSIGIPPPSSLRSRSGGSSEPVDDRDHRLHFGPQKPLGHSSITVTIDTYGHPVPGP